MKLKTSLLIAALAIGASAAILIAQDDGGQPPQHRGPGGPGGPGRRPPLPPVIAALDANHDGTIDAQEIDNAPAALRTLDKNGDGKLTMDELLPPRPNGRGPGGPGGPGHQGPPPGEPQANQ